MRPVLNQYVTRPISLTCLECEFISTQTHVRFYRVLCSEKAIYVATGSARAQRNVKPSQTTTHQRFLETPFQINAETTSGFKLPGFKNVVSSGKTTRNLISIALRKGDTQQQLLLLLQLSKKKANVGFTRINQSEMTHLAEWLKLCRKLRLGSQKLRRGLESGWTRRAPLLAATRPAFTFISNEPALSFSCTRLSLSYTLTFTSVSVPSQRSRPNHIPLIYLLVFLKLFFFCFQLLS